MQKALIAVSKKSRYIIPIIALALIVMCFLVMVLTLLVKPPSTMTEEQDKTDEITQHQNKDPNRGLATPTPR